MTEKQQYKGMRESQLHIFVEKEVLLFRAGWEMERGDFDINSFPQKQPLNSECFIDLWKQNQSSGKGKQTSKHQTLQFSPCPLFFKMSRRKFVWKKSPPLLTCRSNKAGTRQRDLQVLILLSYYRNTFVLTFSFITGNGYESRRGRQGWRKQTESLPSSCSF